MSRRTSDDDIIGKVISYVAAGLIILGAIIAFAKVAWIIFLVIAICSFAYWYYTREDMAFNIGMVCLIICAFFIIIGYGIGGTGIGKTSQEFFSLAVNISRIRLNP